MSQGRALCIGVGRVDPALYKGDPLPTLYAEADASAMGALAAAQGFDVRLLTTAGPGGPPTPHWRGRPDYRTFKQEMDAAAEDLRAGDTLLLTFSGHGTVVRRGEWGGADEAWCLADCVILDDTLYQLLTHFEPNVRVWVISDSCYSGTMVDRDGVDRDGVPPAGRPARAVRRGGAGRAPTPEAAGIRPILWRAQHPHARRAIERGAADEAPLEAAVLCLGACREDAQTTSTPPSRLDAPNFSFTRAAIDLWQNGKYDKSCWDYCHELLARWQPDLDDRPAPYWVGNGVKFGDQRPAFPQFRARDESAPVSVAS